MQIILNEFQGGVALNDAALDIFRDSLTQVWIDMKISDTVFWFDSGLGIPLLRGESTVPRKKE